MNILSRLEERAALRQANKIRLAFGHDKKDHLEKGRPNHDKSCPIANTINENHNVSVDYICILVDNRTFYTSSLAKRFMKKFDSFQAHDKYRI